VSDERFHQKRSHHAGRVRRAKPKNQTIGRVLVDDESWNGIPSRKRQRRNPAASCIRSSRARTSAPAQEKHPPLLERFTAHTAAQLPTSGTRAITQLNGSGDTTPGLRPCWSRRKASLLNIVRKKILAAKLHTDFEAMARTRADIEFNIGKPMTLTDVAFRSMAHRFRRETMELSGELYTAFPRGMQVWFVAPTPAPVTDCFKSMRRTIASDYRFYRAECRAGPRYGFAGSASFASAMSRALTPKCRLGTAEIPNRPTVAQAPPRLRLTHGGPTPMIVIPRRGFRWEEETPFSLVRPAGAHIISLS